jgi:sugar diacid utilization regulator
LRVLEAALDHRRHEDAADHCFMHRNTFRHRLRQATDLLGDDLAHPDARLAVHIALKLRHAVDAERGHGAADGRVVRRAVGAA